MKITVLMENTAKEGFFCEHGLSLWIEEEGRKFLLDTGSTELFAENAKKLGIDIGTADHYILSHGHYDHSGGYGAVFRENPEAAVYVRTGGLEPYYSGKGGLHEIGVPEGVVRFRAHFVFVDGKKEIAPGWFLVPHAAEGMEEIGKREKLYRKGAAGPEPDDFRHEQSLVAVTEKGLVVFNSCSHGGMETILQEAEAACGGPVYAYVGGLHMKGVRKGEEYCTFSEEALDRLCRVVVQEGVEVLYTGHCTGRCGLFALSHRLGSRVKALSLGMQFEM